MSDTTQTAAPDTVQKISLKDIPVESNNFKPPPVDVNLQQAQADAAAAAAAAPADPGAATDPAAPADPNPADPADPAAPEGEVVIATQEDLDADLQFFEEVNRMRGVELAVDYGGVLPSSLEGMVIRDRALEAYTYQKVNAELQARDPRGAAYLLHRMAGGNDEDFFSRKTLVLPDYEMFKDDINLQKQIYKNGLIQKGLSDTKADILVENAVKSNSLFAEADAEYQYQQQEDQKELARLAKLAETEAADYQKKVDALDNMLTSTFKASDLSVVIPDSEQKEYNKFVRGLIQTDGKNFFIAQPLDATTVKAITESLYIQFKKGDLSSILQRKANTIVARQNQIKLGNTKRVASTAPPAPTGTQKKTLGDMKFPGEV